MDHIREKASQIGPSSLGSWRRAATVLCAVPSADGGYLLASSSSTVMPLSIVSSLAAYEMRKCVSRRLKMMPGMIKSSREIASATNSLPVPQGALGKT